ncbi:transcriptional regulator, partial [bacterium]|nr:transcriptional regulator [bacterium]
MQKSLVLTLTGKDQIGLVEKVTKTILEYNGNVDASRMARLGGEFAIIMLISIPAQQFDALVQGMQYLKEEGFAITTRPTEPVEPAKTTGWLPYQIEVKGADHEGIIHAIAQHLAEHRINVETMDTDMIKAPLSGTPLFT